MIKTPIEIQIWALTKLKPYENNSRTHSEEQIDQIAASITEFGFTNPILVDSKDGIIAGHGRLMAAQKLGLKQVPVIILDYLTDAQKRAYVIADNKIALNAGWDLGTLASEMARLADEAFDLSLLGFSQEELDEILVEPEELEGTTEEDDVPSTPVVPTAKRGEVYILGSHRVICGDSTNLTDVEKLVGKEPVECLWTDPPYNVAYEGSAGKIQNDDMDDSSFRQFLRDAFVTAFTVMKAGGAAYVAHADTEGFNFRGAFLEAGFKISSCVIWRKNSLVLGRSDYQWQHEPILYGWKEGAAHRWYGARNKTTMMEFEGGLFEQIGDKKWQIRLGQETLIIEGDNINVELAHSSVITEEKPKRNAEHPTMKPVALVERFLNNSTKKGDIVLDLFGGSGSTLIACEKLGRKARLVELDEKFVDVIINRWQDFTGKKAKRDDGILWDDLKVVD
jgi:DNA modification methylase